MGKIKIVMAIIGIAVQLTLSGCMGSFLQPKQDPTRYYIISPLDSPKPIAGAKDVMLNISQVRIPAYMTRQQIVSAKKGGSEIIISDFHRLPEFPVDAFTRVLAANISKIAKSEHVYAYPATAPKPDCIGVRVTIFECMGVLGEELKFKARWELVKPQGAKIVAQKTEFFSKKFPAKNDYDGYVGAMGEAMGELAADIVEGIVEFKGKNYSAE